jgi:uroporphyrin-III C-methyltransferase/precorrin-2 dehydrogenase/sirohydrochlorin ferrochelatase
MPVSLSLKDRKCLVVGGGSVALRKVETLLDYDTDITVVAPEVDEKLEFFAKNNRIALEKRPYRSPEAGDYQIVISASDDMDVNRQVSDDARKAGAPVNVADQPALCDFIFPAVLRRDCLTVAVCSDGKAPFMSGHLKLILEGIFPQHWSKLMQLAVKFRKMVLARWSDDFVQKTSCYTRFVEADWKTILKKLTEPEIDSELENMLAPVQSESKDKPE